MPALKRIQLVQGSFGVQAAKGEAPSKADPSKMVEIDTATFIWSDGMTTYLIQIDEELFGEIEKQMAAVREAWDSDALIEI